MIPAAAIVYTAPSPISIVYTSALFIARYIAIELKIIHAPQRAAAPPAKIYPTFPDSMNFVDIRINVHPTSIPTNNSNRSMRYTPELLRYDRITR